MVRAGSHEGQLVKGEWRVSPNDASTTKDKPFEYGGRVFPDSLEDKKKAEDKKALTMSNVKKKALEDKKKTQEDKKEALNKALLESYITVEDFSKKSGIKPSQIISMVRGGSHEGRLVNGQWLVSPDSSSLPKDKLNSLHKPNDTTVLEVIREDAEGYITVEAYSEKYGIKASQVINMIEAGYNEGKLVDGELLVRTDVEATSRYKTITSTIEINRPLNWCYFWNYGLLPLNFFVDLIFVLGGQQIFAMSPAIMLALLVHGSMAAALVIGLHKRTEWAWTLNGYFLVFSVLLQVTGKYGHKGVGDIIVWVIMLAIVWLWPNHVYWTKRKHLFNT